MARLHQIGPVINSVTNGHEADTFAGTIAISSSHSNNGVYALRTNPTTSKGYVAHRISSGAISGAIFLRFYIYIVSYPASFGSGTQITIATFPISTTPDWSAILNMDTNGNLGLYDYNDTLVGSTTKLNLNTLYRVEVTQNHTAGSLSWKLNGTTIGSTASGATLIDVDSISVGPGADQAGGASSTHSCSCDMYFSDIAVNDSTGASQTSFPGAGQINGAFPNAAGDNNAWTVNVGGTAGASNNYTRENENPPDDITSYNGDITTNDIDDYAISAPPGMGTNDTINVVMLFVRYRAAVASLESAFKVRYKKVTAGTVTSSAEITPTSTSWTTNANSAPKLSPLIAYKDPDGGTITKATLNTSQIGQIISTGNTNAVDISTILMSIDYTPVTTTNHFLTLLGVGS